MSYTIVQSLTFDVTSQTYSGEWGDNNVVPRYWGLETVSLREEVRRLSKRYPVSDEQAFLFAFAGRFADTKLLQSVSYRLRFGVREVFRVMQSLEAAGWENPAYFEARQDFGTAYILAVSEAFKRGYTQRQPGRFVVVKRGEAITKIYESGRYRGYSDVNDSRAAFNDRRKASLLATSIDGLIVNLDAADHIHVKWDSLENTRVATLFTHREVLCVLPETAHQVQRELAADEDYEGNFTPVYKRLRDQERIRPKVCQLEDERLFDEMRAASWEYSRWYRLCQDALKLERERRELALSNSDLDNAWRTAQSILANAKSLAA